MEEADKLLDWFVAYPYCDNWHGADDYDDDDDRHHQQQQYLPLHHHL